MPVFPWEPSYVAAAAEDLITDWYLPCARPIDGYVYPGPLNVREKPDLMDRAMELVQHAQKQRTDLSDDEGVYSEFAMTHRNRRYRGHWLSTEDGEMVALRRILDDVPDLSQLGLRHLDQQLLMHPRLSQGGLVLVAGEFGQGKSTTCAALLRARMQRFGAFCLTLEDPPEYKLQGSHGAGRCLQGRVRRGRYAEAIRDAMRCYPATSGSLLFIGEIRDSETAAEVLRVAANGNTVISSIHGESIVGGMKRFISLATADKSSSEVDLKALFASTVRVVMHQSLRPVQAATGSGLSRRRAMNTELIWSPDGASPVAQKIRDTPALEVLNSDIAQQRSVLERQGVDALVSMWDVSDKPRKGGSSPLSL